MKSLISPPEKVLAQVIFGHPASGDWTTLRPEAEELAALGVRSALLQFELKRAGPRDPEGEIAFRSRCVRQILEAAQRLKRDCQAPITYVGKNLGAFLGGIAAGEPSPIERFILVAGIPDLTEFHLRSNHEVAREARRGVSAEQLGRYRDKTTAFNPLQIAAKTRGRDIFLQFGLNDPWIPVQDARDYIARIPDLKSSQFYDDDHDLTSEEARRDRRAILLSSFSASVRGS
ncbi:MAG: hypothetical protein ACXWP5_09295 [Bdellovibrionota bacterium]